MFNFLSTKIAHFFIKNKVISTNDKAIYKYGIEIILSILFSFFTTFLISLLIKKISYFVIFYIFFISLRIYSGGFHTSSYESCLITTNIVYILCIILTYVIRQQIYDIYIYISLFFNTIVVCKFAPIIHKNSIVDEA